MEAKLKAIARENDNEVEVAEKSIMYLDGTIRKLKNLLSRFQFDCVADEIHFFKNIKPLFTSRFMYYAKVVEVEASKPCVEENCIKKHYKSFLKEIQEFYRLHAHFIKYINQEATHWDTRFFLRNQHDIKAGLALNLYDFDELFTTSHDGILSQIWAYRELEAHLLQKLYSYPPKDPTTRNPSPLQWSASKSALIELLYALYQTNCFNRGNIEFSEIVRTTEQTLNIQLGNFYKTLGEIRNRKNGRTKFLQLLHDNLNQLFLEEDE